MCGYRFRLWPATACPCQYVAHASIFVEGQVYRGINAPLSHRISKSPNGVLPITYCSGFPRPRSLQSLCNMLSASCPLFPRRPNTRRWVILTSLSAWRSRRFRLVKTFRLRLARFSACSLNHLNSFWVDSRSRHVRRRRGRQGWL